MHTVDINYQINTSKNLCNTGKDFYNLHGWTCRAAGSVIVFIGIIKVFFLRTGVRGCRYDQCHACSVLRAHGIQTCNVQYYRKSWVTINCTMDLTYFPQFTRASLKPGDYFLGLLSYVTSKWWWKSMTKYPKWNGSYGDNGTCMSWAGFEPATQEFG
jgi:hypothetical protein